MSDNEDKSKEQIPSLPEGGSKGQSPSEQGKGFSQPSATTPPSGTLAAFEDIKRQLTEEELKNPGSLKLVLCMLERSESELEVSRGYIERYHDADKQVAVLQERTRNATAIEIIFGINTTLGGILMGAAWSLWSKQPIGIISLAIGILLVGGGSIMRAVKK